jgi:hemerythrin-like domain-containing protein
MAIQIGAKPDSGFDDPIGMLQDCHRRIERFLNILWIVADHAAGSALTDEETPAVQAALHYFRTGGQRHTADEEESLYPRLWEAWGCEASEQLGRLEGDHLQAGSLHAEVEALYTKWLGAGLLNMEDERRLLFATTQLKSLYEGHIRLEEQIVFPRAVQTLDRQAIECMGREFRARRE